MYMSINSSGCFLLESLTLGLLSFIPALSHVLRVREDAPSSDVRYHSFLTCWHLPHRQHLCAAPITVTADLRSAKNPTAASICCASWRRMGDKMYSRHARRDFSIKMQPSGAAGVTHTRLGRRGSNRCEPQIGCDDKTPSGKWLKITEREAFRRGKSWISVALVWNIGMHAAFLISFFFFFLYWSGRESANKTSSVHHFM